MPEQLINYLHSKCGVAFIPFTLPGYFIQGPSVSDKDCSADGREKVNSRVIHGKTVLPTVHSSVLDVTCSVSVQYLSGCSIPKYLASVLVSCPVFSADCTMSMVLISYFSSPTFRPKPVNNQTTRYLRQGKQVTLYGGHRRVPLVALTACGRGSEKQGFSYVVPGRVMTYDSTRPSSPYTPNETLCFSVPVCPQ